MPGTVNIDTSNNEPLVDNVELTPYNLQIEILNNMGYFDNNLNNYALEITNGNINDAIDFIESLR